MRVLRLSLFCLALLFASTVEARTIYWVVFTATNDSSIGKSCRMDRNNMLNQLYEVELVMDIEVVKYDIANRQCTYEDLLRLMAELKHRIQPDDLVIFYYSGHGRANPNPAFSYPDLAIFYQAPPYVRRETPGFANLEQISDSLRAWGCAASICIGDCCNNLGSAAANPGFAAGEQNVFLKANYEKLFVRFTGHIIMAAAVRGTKARGQAQLGGWFTYFLLESLNYHCRKTPPQDVSWERIWCDSYWHTQLYSQQQNSFFLQTPISSFGDGDACPLPKR
jgi:hypothetical protein